MARSALVMVRIAVGVRERLLHCNYNPLFVMQYGTNFVTNCALTYAGVMHSPVDAMSAGTTKSASSRKKDFKLYF